MADADHFDAVGRLLCARQDRRQAVVVSAIAGMTDRLIGLARGAAASHPLWREQLTSIRDDHLDCARQLAVAGDGDAGTALQRRFERLAHLLEGLELLGSAPHEAVDLIAGLGELCAAELLTAWFHARGHEAVRIDARELIVIRRIEAGFAVDWSASARNLEVLRAASPGDRLVMTGFICRDQEGRVTTLGRNGSDYSASILARLIEAESIQIWTDVDGVLSADPGRVPQALVVPHLSYREAFELAYFGARVIHPQTMLPAAECGIPIHIRNSLRPELPGTRIDSQGHPEPPVKGLSSIGSLALINVEGAGMLGVPGTAERVFAALRQAGISVTMISQGSSEHSICCVVSEGQAELAREVLERAFALELGLGQLHRVSASPGIQVIAAVGEGMAGRAGVAARLFGALGRAGISVRAIAQGASERNLSVAVDASQATRALRAIHAGFYLSEQTLSLGLIGPGQVGRALLTQLRDGQPRLKQRAQLDLRLRGLANSQQMQRFDQPPDDAIWTGRMTADAEAIDLAAFARHIQAEHLPHAVIIDCSASTRVPDHYADWLAAGIHVITPNKQAGSGDWARYQRLQQLVSEGPARWRYEATVGAGLPVIQTLRDLLDTGDRIERIEGILSGTLAWLFHRYTAGVSFAALVREARSAGYTEPDPRDDLSGLDVARKLVILGREMGLALELADVEVESLVPEPLAAVGPDPFLDSLPMIDEHMGERLRQAGERGQVLRYIASLDREGRARVGLEAVDADHPFAHLALTDNVVAFTTARYRDNPLIVRGPGAGPEVTAAGVFADLLRIAQGLGAKL